MEDPEPLIPAKRKSHAEKLATRNSQVEVPGETTGRQRTLTPPPPPPPKKRKMETVVEKRSAAEKPVKKLRVRRAKG